MLKDAHMAEGLFRGAETRLLGSTVRKSVIQSLMCGFSGCVSKVTHMKQLLLVCPGYDSLQRVSQGLTPMLNLLNGEKPLLSRGRAPVTGKPSSLDFLPLRWIRECLPGGVRQGASLCDCAHALWTE